MVTRLRIVILMIALGLGLVLRSSFVITVSLAMLILLGLAAWWGNHALDEVNYRRRFHYTRAFPNETFPLRIEVENNKILPLTWLRVQDSWPKAVGPEDEQIMAPSHIQDRAYLTNVFSLRWFERTRRNYSLLFRKRGLYHVGPAEIESGDLFGLNPQSRTLPKVETLTVFPQLIPLAELKLPAEGPFGDFKSRRQLFEDPSRPMGVREYHPEDGLRRVHWPATARTGTLQVKVFQPTAEQVMMLCLNVATMIHTWEGVNPIMMERLISMVATFADQGLKAGYRVGLISNGCLANSDQPFRIPPGRSPQQLAQLLQALAGVTPLVTAQFDRFLLREIPSVPYGANLVILTAITPPELIEALVRLKRHERRVMLISLAVQPPTPIPGVRMMHLPFVEPGLEKGQQ